MWYCLPYEKSSPTGGVSYVPRGFVYIKKQSGSGRGLKSSPTGGVSFYHEVLFTNESSPAVGGAYIESGNQSESSLHKCRSRFSLVEISE